MLHKIRARLHSQVLRDLLKVLSGNIAAQGLGFLITILISRDLGPEQYGVFSLLLAVFTVSVQIADFGISTSYVKYVSENLSRAREIFLTLFISRLFLALLVMAGLYAGAGMISEFFFASAQYQGLLQLISAAVVFHSLFGLVVAHFQALQRFRIFAWLNICHNFIKLTGVAAIAWYFPAELHLQNYLLAFCFAVSLVLVVFLPANYRLFGAFRGIHRQYLHGIHKMGFWVFLSSLATMVIMRLDIMMLKKMSTAAEVGYYTAAMHLAMIFPLITASLVTTLLPKMYEFLKKRSIEEYVYKVLGQSRIVLVVLLLLELVSPLLIRLFFGSAYVEAIPVFQILLVAFTFGVVINPISLVLYAIDKAALLTLMNWIQLPLNFIGNLLLIPVWASAGAALSTVLLRLFAGLYVVIYLLKVRKCSTD